MNKLIKVFTILISFIALIACSSVEDDLLDIQEKAWQSGRACLNHENLHSCGDFVDEFVEMTKLFEVYVEEIIESGRDDRISQQIILNAKNLAKVLKAIIKN